MAAFSSSFSVRVSPAAWQAVVDTFGTAFVYESARARWRLAEALAEKGHRERAEHEWEQAMDTVERLGAVPLLTALADLARRHAADDGRMRGRVARHLPEHQLPRPCPTLQYQRLASASR